MIFTIMRGTLRITITIIATFTTITIISTILLTTALANCVHKKKSSYQINNHPPATQALLYKNKNPAAALSASLVTAAAQITTAKTISKRTPPTSTTTPVARTTQRVRRG
jgi:hypothetical protein